MRLHNTIIAAVVLSAAAACGTRKTVPMQPVNVGTVQPVRQDTVRKPATAYGAGPVRAAQVYRPAAYNTLAIRGRADIALQGTDNSVGMQMRILSGKKIWISVTAIAGIEVARVLVTPDSVQVLNKLKGQYIVKPFALVQQYAGKAITFKDVEDLLVGNVLSGLYDANAAVKTQGGNTQLDGSKENLIFSFVMNELGRVQQTNLKDSKTLQTLQATYGGYKDMGGLQLPEAIKLQTEAGLSNARLGFTYNSVQVNQNVSFPFTVPGGYTKVQ